MQADSLALSHQGNPSYLAFHLFKKLQRVKCQEGVFKISKYKRGFPSGLEGKESACNAGDPPDPTSLKKIKDPTPAS